MVLLAMNMNKLPERLIMLVCFRGDLEKILDLEEISDYKKRLQNKNLL